MSEISQLKKQLKAELAELKAAIRQRNKAYAKVVGTILTIGNIGGEIEQDFVANTYAKAGKLMDDFNIT